MEQLLVYIRSDLMAEVQLLKNLCNDIHKKSEQFPHIVARNSDLKKLEARLHEISAIHATLPGGTHSNSNSDKLETPLSPTLPKFRVSSRACAERRAGKMG